VKLIEDQIKELRNSFQSPSAISADTNSLFQKKYGAESKSQKISFDGTFVPGVIYIMDYTTKTKTSNRHPFINRNPIFLFIRQEKREVGEILLSLDLNIIPPDLRGRIILTISDQFFNIFKENEKSNSLQPIPNLYNSLDTILKGTGWRNALTGFKKSYAGNVKVLDYQDWVRLPYFTGDKIEGQLISGIYNDYRSKLNL